jgi:di/tricarboxylate transporter
LLVLLGILTVLQAYKGIDWFLGGRNLMVMGPAGFRFSDDTKFGFLPAVWWLLVTVVIVRLYWRF